jgi:protein CpxP
MKNTTNLLLGIAGILLIASPFVRADEPAAGTPPPPPGEKGERREHRQEMRDDSEKMAKELNLTADQQIQFEAIRKQTRESLKAVHNDASLSEDQKHDKGRQIMKSAFDQELAILTPEQQTKAKAFREKHGRRGPVGEHPPGEVPPPPAAN